MQKNSQKKEKQKRQIRQKRHDFEKKKTNKWENCCSRLSKGLNDLLVGKLSSAKKKKTLRSY